MKLDIRNYTYDGKVQLVAARLYQGQTPIFEPLAAASLRSFGSGRAQWDLRSDPTTCC